MVFSIFKSRKFWGSFLGDVRHGPWILQVTGMWGVFAPQKQMKFLEQQQDETKQAREEARRLRSKMQTMERCVAGPACPRPWGTAHRTAQGLWL